MRPPAASWSSRPLPGTPERRLSSSEDGGGLRSSPRAVPQHGEEPPLCIGQVSMGSLGGLGGQQSLMGGMAPIACGSIRPNSGKLRPRSGAATGRSVYRPMSGRGAVGNPTTQVGRSPGGRRLTTTW